MHEVHKLKQIAKIIMACPSVCNFFCWLYISKYYQERDSKYIILLWFNHITYLQLIRHKIQKCFLKKHAKLEVVVDIIQHTINGSGMKKDSSC